MRPFTRQEATEFIESFNIHPSECKDTGTAFEFADIHVTRDGFENELQCFALENDIPLDFNGFTYRTEELDDAPIEVLVVDIPYQGAA